MLVDKTNYVQCIQWVDSRVVNVVTNLLDPHIRSVKRQVGQDVLDVICPLAVTVYQKLMLGVDKGDQIKAHGGGFSRKAHFKTWYKKVYLVILDGMLLNALIVWNNNVEELQLVRPMLLLNDFYL